MRVSPVFAFVGLCVACGVGSAQPMKPLADDTGVTVNLEALPIPLPRAKPTPDEMRPMSQFRPRPKPTPDELALAPVAPEVHCFDRAAATDEARHRCGSPRASTGVRTGAQRVPSNQCRRRRPPAAPVVIVERADNGHQYRRRDQRRGSGSLRFEETDQSGRRVRGVESRALFQRQDGNSGASASVARHVGAASAGVARACAACGLQRQGRRLLERRAPPVAGARAGDPHLSGVEGCVGRPRRRACFRRRTTASATASTCWCAGFDARRRRITRSNEDTKK